MCNGKEEMVEEVLLCACLPGISHPSSSFQSLKVRCGKVVNKGMPLPAPYLCEGRQWRKEVGCVWREESSLWPHLSLFVLSLHLAVDSR